MDYSFDSGDGFRRIPVGKTEFTEKGEVRTISLGQLIIAALVPKAIDQAEIEFARAFGMSPAEVFKRFDTAELAPGYKAIILPIVKRKLNDLYRNFVTPPAKEEYSISA